VIDALPATCDVLRSEPSRGFNGRAALADGDRIQVRSAAVNILA
jgi:hypothetical protein